MHKIFIAINDDSAVLGRQTCALKIGCGFEIAVALIAYHRKECLWRDTIALTLALKGPEHLVTLGDHPTAPDIVDGTTCVELCIGRIAHHIDRDHRTRSDAAVRHHPFDKLLAANKLVAVPFIVCEIDGLACTNLFGGNKGDIIVISIPADKHEIARLQTVIRLNGNILGAFVDIGDLDLEALGISCAVLIDGGDLDFELWLGLVIEGDVRLQPQGAVDHFEAVV